MAKFKVKSGNHVEEGVVYKKGETVKSPYDLVALFPEKFELVPGPDNEGEAEVEIPPAPPPAREKSSAKRKAPAKGDDDGFGDD